MRPTPDASPSMVLYDGACGFCHRGVRFIYARDPRGRFRFAALQSETGRRLLRDHGLPEDALDTLVLVENGRAFVRSTAVLRIARGLRGAWPVLGAFLVVPKKLRDAVYDLVARHRHRVAGDACALPSPGLRERMLE